MNKIIYFVAFNIFVVWGISIIRTKSFYYRYHSSVYIGEFSNYFGILIIIFGLYFLYLFFTFKPQKQKYTICPNCQESYDYKNLDNGKCKYCDNVDTVDIEKYYKDNKEK